jgi:hypothetical protein
MFTHVLGFGLLGANHSQGTWRIRASTAAALFTGWFTEKGLWKLSAVGDI